MTNAERQRRYRARVRARLIALGGDAEKVERRKRRLAKAGRRVIPMPLEITHWQEAAVSTLDGERPIWAPVTQPVASTTIQQLSDGDLDGLLAQLTSEQARRKERQPRLVKPAAPVRKAPVIGQPLFGVIYADPPWWFEPRSRHTGLDRAADRHYATMGVEQIKALPVPAASDCALFLWATVPMLPQAPDVMAMGVRLPFAVRVDKGSNRHGILVP